FGIDDVSFVKQEIVGRKCGLGEDIRSWKQQECGAAMGDSLFAELLRHWISNLCSGLRNKTFKRGEVRPAPRWRVGMRFSGRVSGAGCLPGCVAVLAHVDSAGDVAALNDSFEVPGDDVSWNLHAAAELDLVGVNYALELRIVDFAILHPR